MRVISWNINSVRLRAPLVEKLISDVAPDVICLQETKCPNDSFPEKQFNKLGYKFIAKNGIKGYHGVATLSRLPIVETHIVEYCGKTDGRHVETVVETAAGPVHIHNFYVPAGGDEPDPAINEKFEHKLGFLAEMAANFTAIKRKKKAKRQILLGDLNIAPGEHDVWSSKQLQNVVSHTAVEIEALARVQASLNWEDVSRRFVPATEKLYSWWSYRARDWAASDRGRRLDHIWVTPGLSDDVTRYEVLRDARGWARPSDHAPVMIDVR
ncbi:MAG: Exodeoxyribonuclease III [Rhodobiaceae bacterium UBA7378]|nr:MAG: Exodeoxyribonuclease III [Rhodobiaceae bacterium UBA7378]